MSPARRGILRCVRRHAVFVSSLVATARLLCPAEHTVRFLLTFAPLAPCSVSLVFWEAGKIIGLIFAAFYLFPSSSGLTVAVRSCEDDEPERQLETVNK